MAGLGQKYRLYSRRLVRRKKGLLPKHRRSCNSDRRTSNSISPRRAIKCYEPVAPHANVQGWQDRLTNAFGTTSHDFVDAELVRLMNLFRDREGGIDLRAG